MVVDASSMDTLYRTALAAGNAAVVGKPDGYPCGFAYVNIKPARGPFVNYLRQRGIGRSDSYHCGYTLSSYDCCNFNGQNVDAKEAGVRAFAEVLKKGGVVCTTFSRLD